MDVSPFQSVLREILAGRRMIGIGGPIAGFSDLVCQLRAHGVPRMLLLGSETGTGDLPSRDDADWIELGIRADSVIDAIRSYERALAELPSSVIDAVDAYDPQHEALAIGWIVLSALPEVAGRRRFGARRPDWIALEDKIAVEGFWDRAGVARAPSAVVAADPACLRAAATKLDRGSGTVWAGDNHEGVHGGATYLRWVRNDQQQTAAESFFCDHCRRVRVMPFLEGIPCSIHGIVFANGEAVFRPVELLTLRHPHRDRLLYAGASTYWDPGTAGRDEMRHVAQRTARTLRTEVDYRGAFTVDGVMTASGFRPTELNPRIGFGLKLLEQSVPELPLGLIALAAIEQPERPWPIEQLEQQVIGAVDRTPAGAGRTIVNTRFNESVTYHLGRDQHGRLCAVEADSASDGTFVVGPSATGGFVSFTPSSNGVGTGASIAAAVVEAFAWADAVLATDIGPLLPAVPC